MHRDDLTVEKSGTGAREIDRRTIAKGVAWTVPVVIVATAAPAAAASQNTIFVSATGKYNGKSNNATFTLFFSGSSTSKVAITAVTSLGEVWTGWIAGPQPLAASGSQLQLSFTANRPGKVNTAVTVTIMFKIDDGAEQPATVNLAAGPQ